MAYKIYNLFMKMPSNTKLISYLQPGRVYRREALLHLSKALDRDLMKLTRAGKLEKVGAGLYYKSAVSRFGALPPKDEELVKNFLRDDSFLLYSWNEYNSLGLGLTQIYNRFVVYNQKRHGVYKLGNREFDFRRPARGFPNKVSLEFLLVDLVNNLNELAEDADVVKAAIKKQYYRFNHVKVNQCVKKYGKIATQRFFKEISNQYTVFASAA